MLIMFGKVSTASVKRRGRKLKPVLLFVKIFFKNTALFLFRVHYAGLNVTRPDGEIGKYKSIPHHHRGEVQFLGR